MKLATWTAVGLTTIAILLTNALSSIPDDTAYQTTDVASPTGTLTPTAIATSTSPVTLPDLVISRAINVGSWHTCAGIFGGGFSVCVSNQGNAPAGTFVVSALRSPQGWWEEEEVTEGLGAGDTYCFDRGGGPASRVIADVYNSVEESDEANNAQALSLPTPGATCTLTPASTDTPRPTDTFTPTPTVTNTPIPTPDDHRPSCVPPPGQFAFYDDFDSTNLKWGWWFVRESPTDWSLAARPGYMRILTQEGDILQDTNSARNILLRSLYDSYYVVSMDVIWTNLEIHPTNDFHQGGILVYQDDDNFLALIRTFASGQRISFISETNGEVRFYSAPLEANVLELRIVKEGNTYTGYSYTGYYRTGTDLVEVAQFEDINFVNPQVGLGTWNGEGTGAPGIPVDFQDFCLLTTRCFRPGGHSLLPPVIDGDTVTLSWTPAAHTNCVGLLQVFGYRLQIDRNPNFTSPLIDIDTGGWLSYTTHLPAGHWYWRVRAPNACCGDAEGYWSGPAEFDIVLPPTPTQTPTPIGISRLPLVARD